MKSLFLVPGHSFQMFYYHVVNARESSAIQMIDSSTFLKDQYTNIDTLQYQISSVGNWVKWTANDLSTSRYSVYLSRVGPLATALKTL